MNILDQRCLNHALREAAVQCPSCRRFFCRECVTEHQGRMICGSCVTALTRGENKTARAATARWTILALAGILLAWLVFYYLGLTLSRIPSKFHDASILWGRASARSRLQSAPRASEPRPQGAVSGPLPSPEHPS